MRKFVLLFVALCFGLTIKAQTCFSTFNDVTGKTKCIVVAGTDTIFGGDYGIIVKNQTITAYTSSNGLPSNNVSSVAVASNGDLWIGTDAGVVKFNGTDWTIYNTVNGLVNNQVTTLFIDANYVWIGTGNGLSRWNGTTFTNFPYGDLLFGNNANVTGIVTSGEFCYITAASTTSGKAIKFNATAVDDASVVKEIITPSYGCLTGCFLNGNNELLIAAYNGLVKLALPAMTFELVPNSTIGATKYAWEVVSNSNGDIYVSLANPNGYERIDGQLFKFNGSNWSEITGISNPNIWALTVSNDVLLLGTATSAEKSITCVDFEQPTPPTNLVQSNVNETWFTLSWTASTDNIGVIGYDVYKDDVLYNSVTETTLNILDLNAGTTYNMTVVAKDQASNFSNPSDVLQVLTADITAPTVPSISGINTLTQTSVNIEWSASSDNVAVTGYEIYKDGTLFGTLTVISGFNTYNINGLNPNTNYSITLKAFDAAGNYSALSNAYIVTTLSTSINSIDNNKYNIFPNPVTETLSIQNVNENSEISIYDLTGKQLINCKLQNGQINISELPNGFYTIKIKSDNLEIVNKFVKQ